MKTHIYICVVFSLLLTPALLSGQDTYTIYGRVLDDEKVGLEGCHVHTETTRFITDEAGNYRFEGLKPGVYKIVSTYVGFNDSEVVVTIVDSDVKMDITLVPVDLLLDEVEVVEDFISSKQLNKSLSKEVVNKEFMQENRSGSLMKSVEKLPGVSSFAIGSGNSKPIIRGMGFNRVVVVDNNIKHEGQQWGVDHGLEIDQYAVENLAIIKGPASLAYGSDAIGGVINLEQTFVPEQRTFGGEVELDYRSNNDLIGGSIALHGRKEKTYFKSRLTYLNYGDYKVPTDSIEYNSYYFVLDKNRLRNTAGREFNILLSGGIVKENVHSVLTISNTYNRSGFFANARGLEIRNSQIDYDESNRDIDLPYQKVNHLKIFSKTDWVKNDHKISLSVGVQNNFRQELSEPVPHGYMPKPPDSLEREFNKYTGSVNLSWRLPEIKRQEITIGLNGDFQHNRIGGWGFIIPDYEQLNGGIFIIDNINLSSTLLLQAGLRYDIGTINIHEYQDWYPTPILDNGDTTGFEYIVRSPNLNRDFNSLTWSLGLVMSYPEVSIRINTGKSFRMPIAKELASDGINYHLYRYEKGNPTLDPEESYQLDVGFDWKKKKTFLNVAVFANYFPNYIYLNPTYQYEEGMQVYQYTQAEVFRYGGELKFDYLITPEFNAGVAFEYVYAEQLSGDKKGFTLPFAPPPSMLIELKYSPILGGIWENTYFMLDYRLTAEQTNIVPPEQETDGFQLVNIGMGTNLRFRKQVVSIRLQVQNLFDTKYYNHTSFYRLINIPEPGRNFLIGLNIPF